MYKDFTKAPSYYFVSNSSPL